MRALFATDGSQHSAAAMVSACRILSAADREVDVMCVAPVVKKHHAHAERLRRRALHILDSAKESLSAEGVTAKTILQTGSPARVLIASSLNYDVTVIGAQSKKDVPMAGLGPVASRLVEHSSASILIGREMVSGTGGVRILAAVDGSDGSLRALDKTAALVDLSAAEITLIHVPETPWLHAGLDEDWIGDEQDKGEAIEPQAQLEREFVREGEGIIERARARLPVGPVVTPLISPGLPADEILAEADTGEYDLVVVSASGVMDLKHQMLGSVSSKVAWNAPCSVLLVRSGD